MECGKFKNKDLNKLKLTPEEIKQFASFQNVNEEEINEIRELVYQFSLILYKTNQDGKN